jgi:hypothetical protein
MKGPPLFHVFFFTFVFLVMGLLFSAVYLIAFVGLGGMPREDGSIISPVAITAMYMTTCLIGGILMGMMRGLFASTLGTLLLGTIAAFPLMAGGFWIYTGATPDWYLVIIASIMIGIPAGLFFRKEYYKTFTDIRESARRHQGY